MSDNFFRIKRGTTLDPQTEYGSGDPVGTNGDIYYNQALGKFRKFEGGFWSNLDTGGSSSSNIWVANDVTVPTGVSTTSVGFTNAQPDLSYVIFAQLENLVDPLPQFQQVEVTSKTTTGFTVEWNIPTDSANYRLVYIVPPKVFTIAEPNTTISSTSLTSIFAFPQSTTSYGLMTVMQNLIDSAPQFQTSIVTNTLTNNFTVKWNSPTTTANYYLPYAVTATGFTAIGSGLTFITGSLPVNYGTTNYAVIAMMYDTTDTLPQFQPIVITAKNNNNFTASWNAPTDSANYVLMYYALSIST